MLTELKLEDYGRVRPLLQGGRVNMEIRGVVAGNNPGWVFADDRCNPQTALVFSRGQSGFYFVGREDNPRFIEEIPATMEELRPRLAELGISEFEYSGASLAWGEKLPQIFANRDVQTFRQHVYTFPELKSARLPEANSGSYQAEELTPQLLSRVDIDTCFAKRILLEWWDSLESFYASGAGCCVICARQIAALCYTSFVGEEGEWELGVDTHPDFRRRGFAKMATLAMVRKCQENGVIPYWDCMATNIPSRRLAKGVGFSLAFTYPVFWFSLK